MRQMLLAALAAPELIILEAARFNPSYRYTNDE